MSRRSTAKPTGIQMFPFLAVLICTMGALVVLLHAFASHGQAKAIKLAEAKAREQKEAESLDADFYKWRVGHLREAREKTQAQLAEERLKLSHVEDHQRRLQEKLDELQVAATELERAGAEKADEKERNAADLAETKAKLATAKGAVAKARQSGKHKAVNYSVVPFEGRNSTNRRPIYIECRAGTIVLQPEGIELNPRDFIGFFGPGNPLASALRAQREYFARQATEGKPPEEPYPLLLVRPDGIDAYYAARAALDSWGSDFGYELVGADWDLKFPDRDARLAELTERVVAEARERHREYVLSSSQVARRRSRPVYHAKSHGGFAQEPGTGDGPQGSGLGEWDDYQSESDGAGTGDSRGHARSRGDGWNGTGGETYNNYGQRNDLPTTDPLAEPGGMNMRPHPRTMRGAGQEDRLSELGGGPSSEYYGGQYPSSAYSGEDRQGATGGQGGPSGPANGGKTHSGSASPLSLSQQKGNLPAHNGSEGGNPELRNPNSPGGEGGTPAGEQNQLGMPQSAYNNAPATPALPEAAYHNTPESLTIGNESTPYTLGKGKKMPASMAGARGHDWGLMGTGVGAVHASRPILIHCYSDRLVVVSESREQRSRVIRFGDRTQDSVDDLISAVWDNVKVWGKAGRGLYWKPTLVLEVRPGGEQRFEEIQALLADSGLDVERRRRPNPATARQPSPTQAPAITTKPAVQPIRK